MIRKTGLLAVALGVTLFAAPVDAQEVKAASKQLVPDPALAKGGKSKFASSGCSACHSIGKGKIVGPDLNGVFERRTLEWIKSWLKNPGAMLETDDAAKAMLKEYNGIMMPDLKLTDDDIEALIHYIASEQKAKK